MRRVTIFAGVIAAAAMASLAGGCADYASDCALNPTLPCFWTIYGSGTGGTGGSTPECVPSEENPEIDDACGVFVSAHGSDANGKGTKEAPYLTLGRALSEGSVVYACADAATPFDEAAEPAGDVTLYGGLDCANGWLYDPTKKSAWTAQADSVPLVVGGKVNMAVYDFTITARDAEQAGESSMAVLVYGPTTELTLERCEVTAGNGQAGVTPPKPAGVGMPGQPGDKGQDGCVDLIGKLGGIGGQSMCEGTFTDGGNGGQGSNITSGGKGSDGEPQPGPQPTSGKGGIQQTDSGSCGTGKQGAQGAYGQTGDGGAGLGTLTEAGYTGVWGGDGKTNGSPGQGGGGGGGAKSCEKTDMNNKPLAGPGGGGGGSGGCGGEPGLGGGPGGASIGIASVGAKVMLAHVTVTSKTGGTGGAGGDGQLGGLGGSGGDRGSDNGDLWAQACTGGSGGKGGDGGGGGGGTGGHSVGIAFTGKTPVLGEGVTIQVGVAAFGGIGGNNTMDVPARGAPGRTCKTLSFDDGSCAK